jgi:hypothetical protein
MGYFVSGTCHLDVMSYAYKGNMVMRNLTREMQLMVDLYGVVILHDHWVGDTDVGEILYNHTTGHHFTILECTHKEFMVWDPPKEYLNDKTDEWRYPVNYWRYRKHALIKTTNQKLLMPGDILELL